MMFDQRVYTHEWKFTLGSNSSHQWLLIDRENLTVCELQR